ncbi:hypothetical protein GGI35DRAFT_479120 [Trichoderma velutinum]
MQVLLPSTPLLAFIWERLVSALIDTQLEPQCVQIPRQYYRPPRTITLTTSQPAAAATATTNKETREFALKQAKFFEERAAVNEALRASK